MLQIPMMIITDPKLAKTFFQNQNFLLNVTLFSKMKNLR